MTNKPVLLCILDGWGYREASENNAIAQAHTPHWDSIWREYPHSLLRTDGLAVGLPEGQMGNSEVGHMTIGSGRIVLQDLPRIDKALAENKIATLPAFKRYVAALKASGGTCHLMGLLSDGGVHAHIRHIIGLARLVAENGVNTALHIFTDGRDTPPKSAQGFVAELEKAISGLPLVTIATVSGRYYAMDRDNRWERIELAYRALADGAGPHAASAKDAITQSHKSGVNDEFILPTVIGAYKGMQPQDGILMANFRADRAREILQALLDPAFTQFARTLTPASHALGMVDYSDKHTGWMESLFAPQSLDNILGEIIAGAGRTQLRIAETEKYAHVTFFFNGGREELFPGEQRILVPSPKIATYDLQPEMSSEEVTAKLVDAILNGNFDLIVANYANTDMVGHSGIEGAAVKAVEAVDKALGALKAAILKAGGAMIITADHGNAEEMFDEKGNEPHTQHTLNPVPCILISAKRDLQLTDGKLCDIAPTILAIMGLKKPAAMTGISLLRQIRS